MNLQTAFASDARSLSAREIDAAISLLEQQRERTEARLAALGPPIEAAIAAHGLVSDELTLAKAGVAELIQRERGADSGAFQFTGDIPHGSEAWKASREFRLYEALAEEGDRAGKESAALQAQAGSLRGDLSILASRLHVLRETLDARTAAATEREALRQSAPRRGVLAALGLAR